MTVRTTPRATRKRAKIKQKRPQPRALAKIPDAEYRVGPGHPPREYQFKPGQSGNPKGARRKSKTIAPDLKMHLQEALNSKINLKQDSKERIVTKAAAGIEQAVNAFAEGDRHALRCVLDMARWLKLDLDGQTLAAAPSPKASSSAEDEAILADFLRRHRSAQDAENEPTQPHESHNNDGEHDEPAD
jgi:Family of unknown function (DUF5681)